MSYIIISIRILKALTAPKQLYDYAYTYYQSISLANDLGENNRNGWLTGATVTYYNMKWHDILSDNLIPISV